MKKIILLPLLLFFLACHNKPAENNNLPISNNVPKDYSADSTKKWTRNLNAQGMGTGSISDTVNFTDANNLKQGKWVTLDARGQVIKTQYYKNGVLVKGC
ncbi:MAG: hypothetical protein ACXVPU_14555 [Bacteroidia bacterium]